MPSLSAASHATRKPSLTAPCRRFEAFRELNAKLTALERRLQLMPGEQAIGVARRGAGEELDIRLGT